MNYYLTTRLGAIVLLIIATCGYLISIDTLLDEVGLITTLIYKTSILSVLLAIYFLLRKDEK